MLANVAISFNGMLVSSRGCPMHSWGASWLDDEEAMSAIDVDVPTSYLVHMVERASRFDSSPLGDVPCEMRSWWINGGITAWYPSPSRACPVFEAPG